MLQASQQESGRDEQDKGEGDLHDDEGAPRELVSARDPHRVFRCATWHAGVEAVACWQQADEQAGQRGQPGGEHEYRPIDRDGADARQFGRAECQQRVHCHCARTMPRMPPRTASSSVSTSSWRMIRNRDAPSAVRTASSVRRSAPCASSRLVAFTHAIVSSRITAPRIASSAGLTLRVSSSCSGLAMNPCGRDAQGGRGNSASVVLGDRVEFLLCLIGSHVAFDASEIRR